MLTRPLRSAPRPFRRLAAALTASVLLLTLFGGGALAATSAPSATPSTTSPPPIQIFLDGVYLPFDSEPFIDAASGRTMVPFRAIAEALGVAVEWDGEHGRITGNGLGHSVELTVGSRQAVVDGTTVALDVAPRIANSRTMLPLRFFTESFGAQVGWQPDLRLVTVDSPPRRMETLGFYAIRSFDERESVSHFDRMAYGWSRLTGEGLLDLAGSEYRWPEPAGEISGESLLEEARAAGTERYLMVWAVDGKGDVTRVLADDGRIQSAAAEIARVVREKGFDGAVLDLEGLGLTGTEEEITRVRERFTRLVTATGERLSAQGSRLMVAVPPPNSAFRGYDLPAISQHADRIMLMTYDYVQEGSEPVELVHQAVRLALQVVPAEKLLLGVSADRETAGTLRPKLGLAKRYSLAGVGVWRLGLMGEDFMQQLQEQLLMK